MSFNQDMKNVDELYKNLLPIATDLVEKSSKHIDDLIKKVKNNMDNLTNQELSSLMLQLSIEAYFFGQRKDQASLKQACADILYKEGFAKAYTLNEGTQAQRQNQSLIDTTDKQAVKLLYDAASSLMKTKLDELHRIVNVLNSVMINRNAEAKFNKPDIQEHK